VRPDRIAHVVDDIRFVVVFSLYLIEVEQQLRASVEHVRIIEGGEIEQ